MRRWRSSVELLSPLLVFVGVGAAVWWLFRPPASSPDVRAALAAEGQVVDVRTVREFEQDAVTGARNIPVDQLGRRMVELDRARPVIVYCASGRRSAVAARMLRDVGYPNVVDAGPRAAWPV
jgi:rhodanese-related sulfurtransferase